jgi:hypothetical protein
MTIAGVHSRALKGAGDRTDRFGRALQNGSPMRRSRLEQGLSRYNLLEQLGRSGMGSGWKARDPLLSHANIATIYDLIEVRDGVCKAAITLAPRTRTLRTSAQGPGGAGARRIAFAYGCDATLARQPLAA